MTEMAGTNCYLLQFLLQFSTKKVCLHICDIEKLPNLLKEKKKQCIITLIKCLFDVAYYKMKTKVF